jgi:hypothetical protein
MSDQIPIYLVDIISDVVASVQADVLTAIQANETAAINLDTQIQTVNYQYGHKSELIETLYQMDKTDLTAYSKYPCIFLVMDFKETVGGTPGIYANAVLNVIIMHHSTIDDKTTDRYVKVFKPVLYPLYLSFLKALSKHKAVHVYNVQSLKHDKYDRPKNLVGNNKNSDENEMFVNDYVDAIEIQNLNLLINSSTCIN